MVLVYCSDDEDKMENKYTLKTNEYQLYILSSRERRRKKHEKECDDGTKCAKERM